MYRQSEKLVKQQYLLHMSPQYGELRPTSSWDRLVNLGHACKFQRVLRLGSFTARHSGSERQPYFAALNRGCHLYSAGRPSRWALSHLLVYLLLLIGTGINRPVRDPGTTALLIHLISALYIYCLLVYSICFPTYPVFFTFFPYLSTPLLIFASQNRHALFPGLRSLEATKPGLF